MIFRPPISQVFPGYQINQAMPLSDPTEGRVKKVRYVNYSTSALLRVGLLTLLLSACRANGIAEPMPATVEVTLLTQSSQCWSDVVEPSVAWITGSEAYKSAYEQTRRHILGGADYLPAVDFTRSNVVVVYMGKYSTAGYQLELAAETAAINDHELTLFVSWVEPPVDALMAQVITSPCLLVSIPKGDYLAIRVRDAGGGIRASTRLLGD